MDHFEAVFDDLVCVGTVDEVECHLVNSPSVNFPQ